jgi:hypothetical protein
MDSLIIDDIHHGIIINPYRDDLFRWQFMDCLKQIDLAPKYFGVDRFLDLSHMIFQLIENVYEHADRKPLNNSYQDKIPITSYFSIENILPNSFKAEVFDNGVGIAARQYLNLSIYSETIEKEKEILLEALSDRGSCKIKAQDCHIKGISGYGFTYVLHYLKRLGGTATLQTGRLQIDLPADKDKNSEQGEITIIPFRAGSQWTINIPVKQDHWF